jgi:type I restriction enzyme S subunit
MGDPNLRACILPEEIPIAINKADCINCKPNPKIILPKFLCYLLNNENFIQSVSNLVLGETRGRISMGRLSKVDIFIPPLSLQNRFAILVDQVDQLRKKQKESENVLENLFNSLMQKYFG